MIRYLVGIVDHIYLSDQTGICKGQHQKCWKMSAFHALHTNSTEMYIIEIHRIHCSLGHCQRR